MIEPLAAPYILESLVPETWYTFRFAARNDVGIGPFGQDFRYQMPRRNVPETPKIILPDYNPDDEITPNTVVNSKYPDRFELRWNVPHDNGELIDSYYIRYCIVSTCLFFCLK